MRHNNVRGWLRDVRSILRGADPDLKSELLDAVSDLLEVLDDELPAGAGDGEDSLSLPDGSAGADEETGDVDDVIEDELATVPGVVRVDGRAGRELHGAVAAPGGAGGRRPGGLPTVLREVQRGPRR